VDYISACNAFREIAIFAALDPAKQKLLAFASDALSFDAGDVLFRGGDAADCAYLIEEGEVDVCVEKDGEPITVEHLGRHDLVGEMGVLRHAPRVATVRATTPLKVLRIDGDMFLRFVTENPGAALGVMRMLSEKIARATDHAESLEHRLRALQPAGRE
jgi:CRP-like cAMP-binding protein